MHYYYISTITVTGFKNILYIKNLKILIYFYCLDGLPAGGREFVFQRLAKYYTALQTVRHRFYIYAGSCVALAL